MALKKRRPGLVYPVWEDWHYVGETDEPAFGTNWSNAAASSYPKMAFRLRETGIVDLVGCVTKSATGSSYVFTLPAGYRPLDAVGMMPYIRSRSSINSGQLLVVNVSGEVIPLDGVTPGDIDYISGSFFLDSADAI